MKLDWQGPISIPADQSGILEALRVWPNIAGRGVYLWCLRRADAYVIVYVGKADDIRRRLTQEMRKMQQGRTALFSLKDGVVDAESLSLEFIPDYDNPEKAKRLIDGNLKSHVIFYATWERWDTKPVDVEGALQIHLRRRPKTRVYLMTEPSSYRLRETILEHTTPTGVLLLGINV